VKRQEATIPDPRHDFGAWVAAVERRAFEELWERVKTPADLAIEGPPVLEELQVEIDGMADALGIPVAPLDPVETAEFARRQLAMNVAVAMTPIEPFPPGASAEERETRFQEVVTRINETMDAILRGELQGGEFDRAEAVAREDLAQLFERRSRGEQSYLAFARALRARSPSTRLRADRTTAAGAQWRARPVVRPRERRAGSRSRRVRAGPASSDDGSADPHPRSPVASGDSLFFSNRDADGQLGTERLRTEALSREGHSSEWLSPERPSTESQRSETVAGPTEEAGRASELGELSERARRLLAAVPAAREEKSAWLKELAADEEITVYLVRLLGAGIDALSVPFRCLLHAGCYVVLTRGRNTQIVYRDRSLARCKREFQTIPELAVALRTGLPKRLRPLQLALWSLRLYHDARLIELPAAAVPQVTADSPEIVRRARDGFGLLLRCRWFLDPREPVSFTRSFVEPWCGIPASESRVAIYSLIQQEVITKVGEAASNFKNATSLYFPGEVRQT
jgi:hypothetical protein